MPRKPWIAILAAALALLSACGPPDQDEAAIGGPFTLTSHEGERVSEADFAGDYKLIYFGYTYCPDVCPMELAKMSRALEILADRQVKLDRVQPLFITVDPARDTVEQVAGYVSLFHPKMVGLTGSQAEIDAVTDAYRIYSRKAEDPGAADYLVDHSSLILLMGPDGGYIDFFSASDSAEDIANAVDQRIG